MEDKRRGSVYQDWNEDLRKRYIRILDIVIKSLIETPYYPFVITKMDILKIREAAKAMNLDISDVDLRNKDEFFEVRGKIIKTAIEKVEETLRPTDPYAQVVNALGEHDVRQMEGENI